MRRTLPIVLLWLVSTLAVGAYSVVPASFSELVAGSALIVRGVVIDARAVLDSTSGISTIGTIAVESTLKGTSRPFVSVRLPGGEMGSRRVIVVGAPRARVGDRAVWFLTPGADGIWIPVGLSLGVFRVDGEGPGGRVVEPPALSAADRATALKRGYGTRRSLAVPEFEALVRLLLDAGRPAGRKR